ncbi:MAG: hypothetical protein A3K10_12495 [Bacteroidetes bacterium RIFCSPLOWO2_12_FULL_31_6]|nr:MAG: hypothetical protein A3K10_12495 [Bacteroidetes bacterium RIFCSPLOWO2_12_FULL_31_6]
MKTFYIFLAFFLPTTLVKAQTPITITSNDMPIVNDTIRYSSSIPAFSIDLSLTGTNYLWDFSTLTPNSQRIDTFFSVTTTPFAYQFFFNNIISYPAHKASYAIRGQDITFPPVVPIPISFTEVFNFIKNSSTKYENVGFGSKISGFPNSTRKNPIDIEYEFPLNYSDTSYSNSEFSIAIPTLAYYGQTMERENKVDGWGTLKTPSGTFNVLRVKSILTKVDTLFLDTLGFGFLIPRPEEIEYKWLANNMSTPVLKIVTNAGIVTTIEYQDTAVFVGVEELTVINNITIFPNPTKEFVQVIFNAKNAGKLDYSIKDINGRIILKNNFTVNTGKNLFLIDLKSNQLSNGIYFIELLMNDQVITQKIVFSE